MCPTVISCCIMPMKLRSSDLHLFPSDCHRTIVHVSSFADLGHTPWKCIPVPPMQSSLWRRTGH